MAKPVATAIVGWIFIGRRICKCYGQSRCTTTVDHAANIVIDHIAFDFIANAHARHTANLHDRSAKFIIIVGFIVTRSTRSKFCSIQSISVAESSIKRAAIVVVIIVATTLIATATDVVLVAISTTNSQFTQLGDRTQLSLSFIWNINEFYVQSLHYTTHYDKLTTSHLGTVLMK